MDIKKEIEKLTVYTCDMWPDYNQFKFIEDKAILMNVIRRIKEQNKPLKCTCRRPKHYVIEENGVVTDFCKRCGLGL